MGRVKLRVSPNFQLCHIVLVFNQTCKVFHYFLVFVHIPTLHLNLADLSHFSPKIGFQLAE